MSQKWAYHGIESLSERVRLALHNDIQRYPWFGMHDNLNLPFHVYEQQLGNQSHFDSGTAATILIMKDPDAVHPDLRMFHHQRAIGALNTITLKDILMLESDAASRFTSRAVSHVLSILTDAPAFDFANFAHKEHSVFTAAQPVQQLPLGPEHVTCQYMLNTVHIEEASYEGNDRVLKEWWCQLGLNTVDGQKQLGEGTVTVWVGDQLTVSRLCGLQRFRCADLNSFDHLAFLKVVFGWFHAQLAYEHSLRARYYGTQRGFGFTHAFDLLKRKGLHAPSIQGDFHHHLKEALYHIAEARFQDLWCTVAKVNNLKELRSRSPEQLHALATLIVGKHASSAALQKLAATKDKDDLLYQSAQLARDLLDYIDLDEAMQVGDVGRMEDHLPRLLFRFAGGHNKNYTIEILELLQGLHREWPPDLR
jgi:hypothetical protein